MLNFFEPYLLFAHKSNQRNIIYCVIIVFWQTGKAFRQKQNGMSRSFNILVTCILNLGLKELLKQHLPKAKTLDASAHKLIAHKTGLQTHFEGTIPVIKNLETESSVIQRANMKKTP